MYFLHDTHHGTIFSTFSLISRQKMKMKTCQFSTILYLATRSTYSRWFLGILFGCGENNFFYNPSKPFLMIIVGFFIRKNVYTSGLFTQDLVPILDSSKSLVDYICQVALEDRPFLVYSNNDIKEAQTGGGFSFLQMLSLTIVYTTIFLSGDIRRELDVTIADAEFFQALSLNALSMLMYKSKLKEEIF